MRDAERTTPRGAEFSATARQSLVVMGVSGSGKSTVGHRAAALASMPFIDADDLHSRKNMLKMAAGNPLDDADRWPWLGVVARALSDNHPAVVACSALRRVYRDRLRADAPGTIFVLLHLSRAELENRLFARTGHFMPATLLDSQLDALDAPGHDERITVLDAARPVDELAAAVAALAVPRVR